MKNLFLLLLLAISSTCYGQWSVLNIPPAGRYDDIFFINDSVGWAAGGNSGRILKTTNGGTTWTQQFAGPKYLRSLKFATPTLGFCGSLNSSFYKTTDGGVTWTDIAPTITPVPPGICGISAPTPTVIYGCGIWSSPAYVIKSTDGGTTWTTLNLSAYASAVVDIHFISADTGFVAGAANPIADGGIILYTTNGGTTWSVKHKTMVNEDFIWKIQSPDKKHYYGSVESLPTTGNVRMVKSTDKGATWTTQIVRNTYAYIQTIGFIDSLKGWTGGTGWGPTGGTVLLETSDGGTTWQQISIGSNFNRFLKLNDSTAMLSGARIYRYKHRTGNINGIREKKAEPETHKLTVSPNPASTVVQIEVKTRNKTYGKLHLYSADGRLLEAIAEEQFPKGVKRFKVSVEKYPPQMLFLVFKTNEDLVYQKIIKN